MSVQGQMVDDEAQKFAFEQGYKQALADVEAHAAHRDPLAASNIRDAIRAACVAKSKLTFAPPP